MLNVLFQLLASDYEGIGRYSLILCDRPRKLVSRYINNCDYTREILVGGARGKNKAMQ